MFGKFERGIDLELQDKDAASDSLKIENTIGTAERIYKLRRKRDSLFKSELFSDPAWDLLLAIYSAERAEKPISVNGACLAASIPTSTGMRWITILVQNGYIDRHDHPAAAAQSLLRLTLATRDALKALFEQFESEKT